MIASVSPQIRVGCQVYNYQKNKSWAVMALSRLKEGMVVNVSCR